MSTTLSITVGTLTSSRVFANDQKARATLLTFYDSLALGPTDATNQQKLDLIVDWLVRYLADKAVQRYVETSKTTASEEARLLYAFE